MTWCVMSRLLAECKHRQNQALLNQILGRGVREIVKKNKDLYLIAAASDPTRRRLYCWGFAETGALGETKIRGNSMKYASSHRPVRKKFGMTHRLVDIACGYGYTLYVTHKQNGRQLYGSGLNTDSQMGFQTVRGPKYPLKLVYNIVPVRVPLKQPEKTRVMKAAAGRAHSFVLTDKEGVFSFGNNNFGQCARRIVDDEDYSAYRDLWRVSALDEECVVDIVCGHDHSLFLTESGKVLSCGNGADGQTGLGHYKACSTPTLVEGDIKDEKIVKISSASDTVLAINDKGDVFGWGNSEYFQLPLEQISQQVNTPTYLPRIRKQVGAVKDVASAGSASMVLSENGEVFVWGHGLLGKGPEFTFSQEPSLIPMTLFGYSAFREDVKVSALSCGLTTMAAVNNYGDLYTWGKNQYGQLGLGHRYDQFHPMKVSLGGSVIKVCCGVDHMVAMCLAFK